jgi:hypothetical protein
MFSAAAIGGAAEYRGTLNSASHRWLETIRAKFLVVSVSVAREFCQQRTGRGASPEKRENHIQRLFLARKRWEEPFDFWRVM